LRVLPALAQTIFLAHSFFMLTDEQTSPEQFAALRAMTGAAAAAGRAALLVGAQTEGGGIAKPASRLAGAARERRGAPHFQPCPNLNCSCSSCAR
jgi:hypothetical protein